MPTKEQFENNTPGKLVPAKAWIQVSGSNQPRLESKGWAFVPNPLPPMLDATMRADVYGSLSFVMEELGRLDGLARSLQNPHLLLYPLALREAKLSSQIENTIASAEEVVLAEAMEARSKSEAVEVLNYIHALNMAMDSELPISNRLICEMHLLLLQNVRGDDKQPGQFRNIQVFIGGDGQGLEQARFVPPPPGETLAACMNDLERFINDTRHRLPPLVAIAMAHYQFEAIHPFRDGNGRIGRAVAALSLCKGPMPILLKPFVYFSDFFERNRQEYYDHLLRVSTHGDWKGWIEFFLQAAKQQATDASARIRRVLELRAEYVRRVTEPKASSLLVQLVDALFARPAVTTSDVAAILRIKPQAAQRHIDRLVEKRIIEEATGKSYGRIWIARGLLRLIEADDPNQEEPTLFG